jgi:hypothetical protein
MSVAVKWRHGTRDKHKNGIVLPLHCCMLQTGNKQTVLSIDIVMFFQAAPEN